MNNKWIELTISCKKDFLPQLTGLLMVQKIKTWAEEEEGDLVKLKVYIPYYEELEPNIENLKKLLDIQQVQVVQKEIEDENWAVTWQKYFSIEKIGSRIVIKPPWEDYSPSENDLVLEIEPRMAFGSGFHPTTRLTILLEEKYVKPGVKVLDMGCGSGILSILASMLGAGRIYAVDNDPIAIRETEENVKLASQKSPEYSNMPQMITPILSEGFQTLFSNEETRIFDLIMVNISPIFLIDNIKEIAGFVADDGIFLTGSAEHSRIKDLEIAAKEAGLEEFDRIEMDGWIGIAYKKMV
ncbi:MAG: 50S ribosomal protein L11 methyltransferase [Firmicutes bacterium]|nr:50S ribosomal protein L11 methyltransferase [Bacillota bacterium]